jgi:glycerol-3-phosphate acyltransferase PlsY
MAGFLTLILDIVKGFIPVFMAKQFHLNQYYILLIGVLAILGHIYPVYIGFKGGTGMATTLGILLGLMPLEMAFVALLWGLGVAIFKRPALMGLIVIVLLPIIVIINHKPNSIVIAALLISIVDLIISTSSVDHIKSMLRGDEYISVKNKFLKHIKKN